MKSILKNLEKSEVEFEVEVLKEEFEPYIDKAVLNLGKDIEIEGFRKGKAPKNIIEEKIGKERILMEAAEQAIGDFYVKAVLENKVEPISQPKIEIIKMEVESPLVFKAKTALLPQIKLPDYKKIASSRKRNKVSVEEKDIEESLNWLLRSRAKFSQKQGKAEPGDFVEIKYSSKDVIGIDEQNGTKDSFILNEGKFIPGFEDNIIGMGPGEEKEFSVKFPGDYHAKEMAGKDAKFKVKLETVQKVEIPKATDEFAKSLGKFDGIESLRNNIKEGIANEKESAESQRLRAEILTETAAKTEIGIPDILIEREQDNLMHNFGHEVEDKLKTNLKDYLEKSKKTEKELKDSFKGEAERRVKEFLVLREIGIKENIEIKDQEIEEEMNKFLKHYASTEQINKELDKERLREYTKEVIRNEKIFKLLENLAIKS
jgi:trigger factor